MVITFIICCVVFLVAIAMFIIDYVKWNTIGLECICLTFALFSFIGVVCIPTTYFINKAECDHFNKLANTNYTYEEWFWNSEAIQTMHEGQFNREK